MTEEHLVDATAALEQALALHERTPATLVLLANACAQQGQTDRAQALIEEALRIAPDDPDAHNSLGNLLRIEGRLEHAIEHYRRALRAAPRHVVALSNQALCLQDLGKFEHARTCYLKAVEIEPSNPTIATNFATLLFDLGEFNEALAYIESVLHAHPNFAQARVARALGYLRRGDFARGWDDYEWRDRNAGRQHPDAYTYPEWDGTSMADGCLLVCAEQGLGDQIMFASCVGAVLAAAHHCVIECDPRLQPLFARSFPAAHVYSHRKKSAQPWLKDGMSPTAKTWIGSLPVRYRRRLVDFPHHGGYLTADPASINTWKTALTELGPELKIGISWRGGIATTRRATRSIALNTWLPILQLPDAHFVSLQYGDCDGDIAGLLSTSGIKLHHWQRAIDDLEQTAALVSALDLVISVQTSVAHLAGALGRPVWVLVPSIAEWRYGEQGETMPWYPSARLIRQRIGNDWNEVIERVRDALNRFRPEPPD